MHPPKYQRTSEIDSFSCCFATDNHTPPPPSVCFRHLPLVADISWELKPRGEKEELFLSDQTRISGLFNSYIIIAPAEDLQASLTIMLTSSSHDII